MIKHEEMNIMVQYEQANQDVFTLEQMEMFYDYFKQQQKKDDLIDKLYQEELNKPLKSNGKRGYTNSTRLRILKQIKALEEELK